MADSIQAYLFPSVWMGVVGVVVGVVLGVVVGVVEPNTCSQIKPVKAVGQ